MEGDRIAVDEQQPATTPVQPVHSENDLQERGRDSGKSTYTRAPSINQEQDGADVLRSQAKHCERQGLEVVAKYSHPTSH